MVDECLGFLYLTGIIAMLGMITGSFLMRRIDDLAHAIDAHAERYVY